MFSKRLPHTNHMKTYIRLAGIPRSSSEQPSAPSLKDWPRYERQPYLTRLKDMRPFVVEDSRPPAAPARSSWLRFFSMARRTLSAAVALAMMAGAAAAEPAYDVLPVGQLRLSTEQLQWLIAKNAQRRATKPDAQVLSQPIQAGVTTVLDQLQAVRRVISPVKPATAPATQPTPTPAPNPAPNSSASSAPASTELGDMPDIRFTAVDGRAVDLASLRGKVVLIDFWATWCGPCMGEIPHVVDAYNKYHDQGFEVIGISFDTSKAALERVTKAKGMPWPQYFENRGGQNAFGVKFGIHSIPTMWLIDQEGHIVTKNARNDLAGQVAKLLAADAK